LDVFIWPEWVSREINGTSGARPVVV